jgi:serine/threonine protein kinase/class 3 adenylate cyclase
MGTIWMAVDSQLQRRVAVKLMAPERIASRTARHLFEQEAKAIAQFQNPHVVQVHDYGVDGDTPYIVMELLEGEDLETRLQRQGPMAAAAVSGLLNQVARALAAAHSVGIVHRDLKPANLFLTRGGPQEVVKVLDFGLARFEAEEDSSTDSSGSIMGTPRYMSPEQMRGGADIDHRSDLWSLAVVVYRSLTGRYPFSADTLGELRHQSAHAAPEPPSRVVPGLSNQVDAFFTRALQPDPARRFQSALELAAAFSECVEASRASRTAKILVIDDEPDVASLMKQCFRKQIRERRYEFVFASDGEDALEKLRQHPDTDVVLSDINMPRMDGLTFLSRVSEVNPLVKVIIVSAYSDMNNIRVAMNRGAFDFLVKPFDVGDLETTVTKAVRTVTSTRQMLQSTEENQLLRMFVHGGLLERLLPLLHGPGLVSGEKAEATVAFLDIKDFTAVAHRESPESALKRLNTNFEVIVPELTSRGGVVDKFLGDAVMAVFRGPQHLNRGLEACLAARQQLQAMAFRYGESSPYTHGVCIGLDSGEMLWGSIGAKGMSRLDYTVIGEAANTAARLASHAGKDQFLITHALQQRLDESFECVELGMRSLAGSDEPVLVHGVLSRRIASVSGGDVTASIDTSAPQSLPLSNRLAAKQ